VAPPKPPKRDVSDWGEGGGDIYSDPDRVTRPDVPDITLPRTVPEGTVTATNLPDIVDNPPPDQAPDEIMSDEDYINMMTPEEYQRWAEKFGGPIVSSLQNVGVGVFQEPSVPTQDYIEPLGPIELPQVDLPPLPEANYGGGSFGSKFESEDYGQYFNTGGIASLMSGGYPRRTGQISGPGTEKSDSIPAMLSDGEFVMTAKAVRGAGKGDRRKGAKKMYALMHQLERNASRG
jgi:hypothetical protein